MLLAEVKSGHRVKLEGITYGCNLRSRLTSMGLIPGVEVEVLNNCPGRPMLVALNGSRLVLCQKLAGKVKVTSNGNGDKGPATVHPLAGRIESASCRELCLRQMRVNEKGIIKSVKATGELGRRIRDMGLIPNTEVTVVGRAPLKDPVAIRLRDFTLSLRNNEADHITVRVEESNDSREPECCPCR